MGAPCAALLCCAACRVPAHHGSTVCGAAVLRRVPGPHTPWEHRVRRCCAAPRAGSLHTMGAPCAALLCCAACRVPTHHGSTVCGAAVLRRVPGPYTPWE